MNEHHVLAHGPFPGAPFIPPKEHKQLSVDFSRITDRLFCGGDITKYNDAVDQLREVGITHIINARAKHSVMLSNLFKYLWIPVRDDGTYKPTSWFSAAIDFALDALKHGGRVFIHCAHGINRAPSLVYAILRMQGLSSKEAYDLLVERRLKVVIAYRDDAEVAVRELKLIKEKEKEMKTNEITVKHKSNLPRDTYEQHLYPRIRGYSVGEDGEVTSHICLGLPCCGLDLLIEHPPSLTALEFYQIAGEFLAMRQKVKELPSFQVCAVKPAVG